MEDIGQDSYSYYRLHEKIALVSLLRKEMRRPSTSSNKLALRERLSSSDAEHSCSL